MTGEGIIIVLGAGALVIPIMVGHWVNYQAMKTMFDVARPIGRVGIVLGIRLPFGDPT